MPKPKDVESRIEIAVYQHMLPNMPETLQARKPVVRKDDDVKSANFRSLASFIPFVDNARISSDGTIYGSFEYEDTTVPMEVRDPKNLYLVEQIHEFTSIDTAVRGYKKVADKYAPKTGEYTEHVVTVVNALQEVSYALQAAKITDEDLGSMSGNAVNAFIEAHFAKSKSPEVLHVMNQTLRALSRDVKGRINPSRSRRMIAHRKPELARFLFKGRTIHNKNVKTYIGLVQERQFERQHMSFALDFLKRLGSLTVGDGVFNEQQQQLLSQIHEHLSAQMILVKPYREVAAEARFLLSSTSADFLKVNKDMVKQKLCQYMSQERVETLLELPTYNELDVWGKKDRIKDMAKKLEIAIKKSDLRVSKSFNDLLFEPSMFDDNLLLEGVDTDVN